MVDLGEDEEKFDAFMAPLTLAFENLGSVLLNSTNANCNSEEVRKTVIGKKKVDIYLCNLNYKN
jgi:exportin-7